MTGFFRRLYLRWLFRNTPQTQMIATLDVLLMSARRCAYDLGHANSMIDHKLYNGFILDRFTERQRHWVGIFNPKGSKDYSAQLHRELDIAEREIQRCRKKMEEHGLFFDDDIPF